MAALDNRDNRVQGDRDPHVAVFFAPGFEEVEALAVVDVLYRAGISCSMISVTDELEVISSHEVKLLCSQKLADIDFSQYDMLVLPGGIPGTPNLKAQPLLVEQLKLFARHKSLAAICAAPSIYAELGLLKGKKATANPGFQHVLTEHGTELLDQPVVVDGNIITSQGAGTALLFGLEIVRYFAGDELVEKLKKAIVL